MSTVGVLAVIFFLLQEGQEADASYPSDILLCAGHFTVHKAFSQVSADLVLRATVCGR